MNFRTVLGVVAAVAAAPQGGALAAPAGGPGDPSLAGFPPGYIQSCKSAPADAILTVPAPFDAYMRVVCTRAGHALMPVAGSKWIFPNGMSLAISSINPRVAGEPGSAHFTRLESRPLTKSEDAAFRARLASVLPIPAATATEIDRLQVETSTADQKQEYLLIVRSGSTVTSVSGIECYSDCDPMDTQPWAFMVEPDR